MTHREFTDQTGRLWDVWDVRPMVVERRMQHDRRRAPRGTPDRRRRREARIAFPLELREGWLAFQTQGERRRVAPIPDGWESLPDEELARLVLEAQRMRKLPRLIE